MEVGAFEDVPKQSPCEGQCHLFPSPLTRANLSHEEMDVNTEHGSASRPGFNCFREGGERELHQQYLL